jgi:hypothetical protein
LSNVPSESTLGADFLVRGASAPKQEFSHDRHEHLLLCLFVQEAAMRRVSED